MIFDIFGFGADSIAHVGRLESFVSVVWRECYNADGFFQLEVVKTEEAVSLLQLGRVVKSSESPCPCWITAAYDQRGKWIASGRPMTDILHHRVADETVFNENGESAMRRLVADCLPWPCLSLAPSRGLPDVFTRQKSNTDIFDFCAEIGKELDMGFRIVMQGGQLLFDAYKPADTGNFKFATKFGNLKEVQVSISDTNYKNFAVVLGAEENGGRAKVTVGDQKSAGFDRREMIVDARDVQPQQGETISSPEYLERLVLRGLEKLAEQQRIDTIEFTPISDDVQLGDIATCILPEYGLLITARVTTIETVVQIGKTERRITVDGATVKRK